jgi:exodeoxyribonuclease III
VKITTWNVNGFRAVLRKDGLDWVQDVEPDILCLQEIKATLDQLSEEEAKIEGYEGIWNPAERKGYSGTATYFKQARQAMKEDLAIKNLIQKAV